MMPEITDAQYLIWSRDHKAYWRANRVGYTDDVQHAGRYSFAEAEAICKTPCPRAWSARSSAEPSELMVPERDAIRIDAAAVALSENT